MRFEISRASRFAFADNNPQPCKEAYSIPVEDDDYQREYLWYVDIDTLEEFVAFTEKYGPIVFDGRFNPDIIIYDDYLE